ncbi:AraC family transcriptional regulator, partial [Rhizobium ruizarguesonis]
THCGPDRAAKAVHKLSLSEQKHMSDFDHGRATTFRRAEDSRIQRAVVLVESRKGRDVSPEQVASLVGLSPRQFARLFQDNIGMTQKRFIVET